MNGWIDPHDAAIPESALRHCASVFLISPLLCVLVLLTVLYLVQRSSRPWVAAAHVLCGLALVIAACEPCVEILLRASLEHANASLSASLPVAWSAAAIASHLAAYTGLAGLLFLSMRARKVHGRLG
jgi:hypothetical protein